MRALLPSLPALSSHILVLQARRTHHQQVPCTPPFPLQSPPPTPTRPLVSFCSSMTVSTVYDHAAKHDQDVDDKV